MHTIKRRFELSLYYFIILIPFVKPAYFEEITWLARIYWYAEIVAIFIIILALCTDFKLSKLLFSVVLYTSFVVVSTIVHDGDVYSACINAVVTISMCILFECGSRNSPVNFMNGAVLLFEILTYINLLLIIIRPEGLYNFNEINTYHLMGHRNVIMRALFPGVCISVVRSHYLYQCIKPRCWLLMAALLATVILVWSATAIVGYFAYIVCILFLYRRKTPSWFKYDFFLLASVAVFFLVVIFEAQDTFAFFIEGVLHRELTFTGRTIIWDKALYYIKENLFLGYGLEQDSIIRLKIGSNSAHNIFLDLLYESGFVGLGCFSLVIWRVKQKLCAQQDNKFTVIFTATFLCYFIMWNFEPFRDTNIRLMTALFAMAYSLKFSQNNAIYKLKKHHTRGVL